MPNSGNHLKTYTSSRLHRILEICLLLLVPITAIAYPLCLPEDMTRKIYNLLSGGQVFQQLYPWISCGFTPLVLKESLVLTLTATLLFIFAWIKIRGQWLGQESSALGNDDSGLSGLTLRPEFAAFIMMLYFAVTVSWSPIFQQSLHTWIMMAAGMAIMLIVRSQTTPRVFAVRFMVVVVGCGVLLAGIALLQHLGKMPFLPRIDDPRNRMSSLIGHNTGLSSWLMFPLSFSLYFLFINRRTWVRLVSALTAILFIVVIIAAESRAVWVLAIAICIIIPWRLLRVQGRCLKMRSVLGAIAVFLAIIFVFSVSPQTNPMARLPVSLQQRVNDSVLNLDQLRRETRLRILVVTLTELVPTDPLFGSGLGSFSWEYPKAQGDYFVAHPDSKLGTTVRRTDLAHNDYLQILVETGLVGLALMLFTIAMFLRESIILYRKLESPYNRALWWTLGLPVAAVSVHALVDFPFHVAPIAVVTLVSAGLIKLVGDNEAAALAIDEGLNPATEYQSPRRATSIAFAFTVIIFAWFPWAWQALVGHVMVSDAYYNAGNNWLDEYQNSNGQTLKTRLSILDGARRNYREAVINNVFNGPAYEGQATAHVNRADLALAEYTRLMAEVSNTTAGELLRRNMESDAHAAITIIQNQMRAGGLRYHYTYYLAGRAWRILWELDKVKEQPPGDSKAYREAVSALRTALQYNPADSASIRELADLLSASQKTADEGDKLLSELFKTDPWSADTLILEPAITLASEGEIPSAHAMLDEIFENHSDSARVMLARAWLAYYEAVWPPQALDVIGREREYLDWRRQHLAPAHAFLNQLPDTEFYEPRKERLSMLFSAAGGNLKEANKISKARLDKDIWDREARSIYYWTQRELYGGGLRYEPTPEFARTNALLTIYFMTDRKSGVSLGAMGTKEKLTLPEARRLAAFCEANQWWGLISLGLPSILKTFPGDPVFNRLATKLESHGTTKSLRADSKP